MGMNFYNSLNPDSIYSEPMTAMVATSKDGDLEAVEVSERKSAEAITPENYNKTTAFIRASQSGHLSIVRLMLKKETNFDTENTAMFTDLMAASSNGHTEIVKMLLEKGANPNLKDNQSRTALDHAVDPDIKNLLTK